MIKIDKDENENFISIPDEYTGNCEETIRDVIFFRCLKLVTYFCMGVLMFYIWSDFTIATDNKIVKYEKSLNVFSEKQINEKSKNDKEFEKMFSEVGKTLLAYKTDEELDDIANKELKAAIESRIQDYQNKLLSEKNGSREQDYQDELSQKIEMVMKTQKEIDSIKNFEKLMK